MAGRIGEGHRHGVGRSKKTPRPDALAGDKGYSANDTRQWLRARKIEPVIPTRSNEERDPHFDTAKYRKRSIIECTIGWLKECRRVAMRFEKKAMHFLAMVKIAIIRRILGLDLWDSA